MGDKTQPYVVMNLDKPRVFRLDLNALIDLQQATGIKMTELGDFANGMDADVTKLRVLMWAGLRQEDPKLTLEETGRLITVDRIEELTKLTLLHLADVTKVPPGEGKKGARAVTRKSGTGTPPSTPPAK